jgi:hypothetical protein
MFSEKGNIFKNILFAIIGIIHENREGAYSLNTPYLIDGYKYKK